MDEVALAPPTVNEQMTMQRKPYAQRRSSTDVRIRARRCPSPPYRSAAGTLPPGVTVEHVLTHVAGFPLAPLAYPQMLDRDRDWAAFGSWCLMYPPGTELQYHLTSAAWVIGELCERITGSPIAGYLREVLSGPWGLDSIEIGPPVERQGDVAPFVQIDVNTDAPSSVRNGCRTSSGTWTRVEAWPAGPLARWPPHRTA
jgi:CubicO group peptidase (beta-lactamase class C family)